MDRLPEEFVDMDFNGISLERLEVTFKQLFYFVIVAETGSITRSAQRLYITQSALSKNIRLLEERIGTELLAREGRNVVLTAAGRSLYRRWKDMIRGYIRDLNSVSQLRGSVTRTIRMGCFPVLSSLRFLRPYTDRLSEKYPNAEVEILRMNYIRLLEHLNASKADLIFTLEFDLPDKSSLYEWKEVSRHPAVAVMAADHPLADKGIHSFSELINTTLIFSEPEGILTRQMELERLMRTYNITADHVTYANNDLTAYLNAEKGRGVAIGIRELYPTHNSRIVIQELEDLDYSVLAVWNKNADAELKTIIHDVLE